MDHLVTSLGWGTPLHITRPQLRLLVAEALLLWWATCAAGMLQFSGTCAKGERIKHPLIWFDMLVLRKVGTLVVLIPLITRMTVMWAALLVVAHRGAKTAAAAATRTHPSSVTGARSKPHTNAKITHLVPEGGVAAGGVAAVTPLSTAPGSPPPSAPPPGAHHMYASWGWVCMAVLLITSVLRVLLYLSHVWFQSRYAVVVMSDHLLLAAAATSLLLMEAVLLWSDLVRLGGVRETPGWVRPALVVVLAVAGLLYMLVTGDMYFTARHFHHPPETLCALLLGFVVFQGPVILALHHHTRNADDTAAKEAGVKGALTGEAGSGVKPSAAGKSKARKVVGGVAPRAP